MTSASPGSCAPRCSAATSWRCDAHGTTRRLSVGQRRPTTSGSTCEIVEAIVGSPIGLDDLGVTPRIMVTGQRDSAAVLRSGQRAIRAARPVLFVPMRGPGGGLDVRTRKMLKQLGYVGYPLRLTSTFTPRRRWEKRSGRHPYWMLTAEPVDDEFVDRYEWWMEELAAAVPRPWLTESASMRFMRAVDSGGIAHGSTWVTTEVRRMSASVSRSVADRVSSLRSRQSSS